MGVTNAQLLVAGLVPGTSGASNLPIQSLPTPIYIETDSTLAQVLTTGFLNKSANTFGYLYNNHQMALVWTTDQGSVWLKVVVSGENISLESSAEAGLIALPTVTNQIVYATNTGGALAASGATRIFNAGGIDAGLSGTAGTFRSYPSTASTGYLEVFATANSGAFNARLTNAALGQTTLFTLPDPGVAAATVLINESINQMAAGSNLFLDKATGTVIAGAVTINAQAGTINSGALTTAAGATEAITLTNSSIIPTSNIQLTVAGGTNTVAAIVAWHAAPGTGSVVVNLTNLDATDPLDGTVLIDFLVT